MVFAGLVLPGGSGGESLPDIVQFSEATLVSLGLQTCHSKLCLHHHMGFLSLELGPTLIQDELILRALLLLFNIYLFGRAWS